MNAREWVDELEGHIEAGVEQIMRGNYFEAGIQIGCAGGKMAVLKRQTPDVFALVDQCVGDRLREAALRVEDQR